MRQRLSDYQLAPDVLGEGAFGKVRLATSRSTGHKVAVKLIKRQLLEKRAEELLAREVKNHELLRHENIVRLFTWISTPSKYYLVMEFAPRGDLLGFINSERWVSDDAARSLFAQLLRGIAFCHSLGVKHRDIKLENLLLVERAAATSGGDGGGADKDGVAGSDSGSAAHLVLKISDFGLSELHPIGLSKTYCGSPLYAAPELLSSELRRKSPSGYAILEPHFAL